MAARSAPIALRNISTSVPSTGGAVVGWLVGWLVGWFIPTIIGQLAPGLQPALECAAMSTDETAKPAKKGFFARTKEAASGVLPRFSVALTSDRKKFSADAAQDKTKRQLRELLLNSLGDPEFVAAMELDAIARMRETASAQAPAPAEDAIPADACDMLLDGIGRGLVFIATRKGYTETQASILIISDARKKAYVPRLVKIANKWLPAGALGKYEDEILLLLAFAADTLATIKLMDQKWREDHAGRAA